MMNRIFYTLKCLDGTLNFTGEYDDSNLSFTIESDIAYINSSSGQNDSRDFVDLLSKAKIKTWQNEYKPTGNTIEDCTYWFVEYEENNEKYTSKGEESYYPYGYEYLMNAIVLCDKNVANLLKNVE